MLIRLAAVLILLFIAGPVWADDKPPPEVQTLLSDYQAMMTAQAHFVESLKHALDAQQKVASDAEAQKTTLLDWLKEAQGKKK